MWAEFCLAFLLGAVMLYLPGYVAFRAIRIPHLASLSCAPLFSVAAYCLLGIALYSGGVRSSFLTVVLPVLFVVFVAYGAMLVAKHRATPSPSIDRRELRFDGMVACLYVVVGLAVAAFVFVLPLNGPASAAQTYDHVHHFALVRSFADSGAWSSLHTPAYLAGDPAATPFPGASYYPAGWHVLCACLVDTLGIEVSLAANAINFLLVAAVFPLNVALLIRFLFPGNRMVAILGAFCAPAVGAFPWVLVEVWPLYPNAMSLAMLPSVAVCFMAICSCGLGRGRRLAFGAAFLFGLAYMVFTQPNTAFSVGVFLIPFCLYRMGSEANRRWAGHGRRPMIVAGSCVLVGVLIACAWVVLCNLSFMQGVVGYYWPPIVSWPQALLSVAGMSFAGSAVQPIAAVAVVAGVLYSLRRRHYLWLSCSYAGACFIYCVSAAEGDTWLKHLVSGFWYTDPYRTAAFAAVLAIPVMAMGLYGAYAALRRLLATRHVGSDVARKTASAVTVVLVFATLNYLPVRAMLGGGQDAFAGIASFSAALNDGSAMDVYDEAERQFVEEVESAVSDEALVVNQPYDGSLFAYCLSGLNLYYRDMSGYGSQDEESRSVALREGLVSWPADGRVEDAIRSTGAEYVLILERDPERAKEFFALYNEGDWAGIEAIDDSTPGFEVVLAEDDMRLYRITDADPLQ